MQRGPIQVLETHQIPSPAWRERTCTKCGKRIAGKYLKCLGCREQESAAKEKQKSLSNRERQILERISRGEKNRQIAEALMLTEGTIKFYTNRLFKKLGVNSRHEASMITANAERSRIEQETRHTNEDIAAIREQLAALSMRLARFEGCAEVF